MPEPATQPQPVSLLQPRALPGIALASAVALACMWAAPHLGAVSPLLVAIVAGVALRNLLPVPVALQPGLAVAARTMLRAGVVLLGLLLSLPGLLKLGAGVLLIVALAVGGTFAVTTLLGRWLGVDRELTHLIAAGFSICGAAAVAGMQGVVRASQEKVATAVAMVVLFGTTMIPLSVAVVTALDLGVGSGGTFIGGSTHEVAQVVAAAGIAGGEGMLAIAVPIKLARVVLLAPMIAVTSLEQRRSQAATPGGKRPPLVPLFVVGFVAAIALATTGWLPPTALQYAKQAQLFLLAAAMFALGMGVHIRSLIKLGWKPVVLSLLATATIIAIVAAGIWAGLGA
ncbi:putative sulfate exporter family transporter [Buchananella felis]|uniref:YeiH family protein n=1 Tax=Buchananella felis TaxID=3231492 RepID=UPI0035291C58